VRLKPGRRASAKLTQLDRIAYIIAVHVLAGSSISPQYLQRRDENSRDTNSLWELVATSIGVLFTAVGAFIAWRYCRGRQDQQCTRIAASTVTPEAIGLTTASPMPPTTAHEVTEPTTTSHEATLAPPETNELITSLSYTTTAAPGTIEVTTTFHRSCYYSYKHTECVFFDSDWWKVISVWWHENLLALHKHC